MSEPLMTPEDAARYLRRSTETVRRWARKGKLEGRRLPDGGWAFTQEQVEAVLSPGPVAVPAKREEMVAHAEAAYARALQAAKARRQA